MAAAISPNKIAFMICSVLAVIVLLIAGGVVLSVSLANRAIQNEKLYEAGLRQREAESQIRTSIPTCKAIVKMDDASHGAVNASNSPNSYGHRLSRAIHDVNVTSGCAKIVHELNEGWSIAKITEMAETKN